jgi:hypothetical protein
MQKASLHGLIKPNQTTENFNVPLVLLPVADGESGKSPQMTASAVSLYDLSPMFSALDVCLEPKKWTLDKRTCTE